MKKADRIKLLLVDDHALVRAGLKVILDSVPNVTVIGEAESGEDAIAKINDTKPDVVLMDIKMPGIGGLEAAKRLRRTHPEIQIIIVTACSADPYPSKLIQVGVLGFLAKDCHPDELLIAVQKAAKGERYISADIARELALRKTEKKKKSLSSQTETPEEEIPSLMSSLPDRELQVLIMIAKGLSIQEIADKLVIAPKTINTYRYRMYKKFNVKTDVMLAHLAIQQGLVSVDESGNISPSQF